MSCTYIENHLQRTIYTYICINDMLGLLKKIFLKKRVVQKNHKNQPTELNQKN